MTRIGIISDTHGLARPEVLEALQGCAHILHAGDVGGRETFDAFAAIAPVTAVRGNVDYDVFGRELPLTECIDLAGKRFYLVHIIEDLDIDPATAEIDVVLFGHSHQPEQYRKDGALFLNPGSIGRRRFSLPIAWAEAIIEGDEMRIVEHRLD